MRCSGTAPIIRHTARQDHHGLLARDPAQDVDEAAAVPYLLEIREYGRGLRVIAQRVQHIERSRGSLVANRHVLVDADTAPLGPGHELHADVAGLGDYA